MFKTRCKFKCTNIDDNSGSPTKMVTFETQYDETLAEDVSYTKYTPWGQMRVSIDNPRVLANLEVGKAYYIDISPCEPAASPYKDALKPCS